MGLKVGEVRLEKYNPEWEIDFLQEKSQLAEIFGDIAITIEHVGSTSIPEIIAKPIIDIAVGVEALSDFEQIRPVFTKYSEYSIKENSDPGEILVRKGSEDNRTHFIHVMEIDGERYRKTLVIRDILRNNASLRTAYAQLKQDLAKQFPHNRKAYTAGKAEFLNQIFQQNQDKMY